MAAHDTTPKDTQRSPALLIVILAIIVLGIASFLILRPRGTGASNQSNPAAPTSSNH